MNKANELLYLIESDTILNIRTLQFQDVLDLYDTTFEKAEPGVVIHEVDKLAIVSLLFQTTDEVVTMLRAMTDAKIDFKMGEGLNPLVYGPRAKDVNNASDKQDKALAKSKKKKKDTEEDESFVTQFHGDADKAKDKQFQNAYGVHSRTLKEITQTLQHFKKHKAPHVDGQYTVDNYGRPSKARSVIEMMEPEGEDTLKLEVSNDPKELGLDLLDSDYPDAGLSYAMIKFDPVIEIDGNTQEEGTLAILNKFVGIYVKGGKYLVKTDTPEAGIVLAETLPSTMSAVDLTREGFEYKEE